MDSLGRLSFVDAGLYMLKVNSSGDPIALSVSQSTSYPPANPTTLVFAQFAHDYDSFSSVVGVDTGELLKTPIPEVCVRSPYRCPNSTVPSGKIYDDTVVYRAANMDEYIHVLAGENAATPLGVLYFYCNQRTHPYFTKFTVQIDTRFNICKFLVCVYCGLLYLMFNIIANDISNIQLLYRIFNLFES